MKRLSQAQEEKLLEYIDGTLGGQEKDLFEQSLKSSPELSTRCDELIAWDSSLRAIRLSQPSKNFTQRVMDKLDMYPARNTSLLSRNGILLLIGVLVAVGIGTILLSAGVFDGTSSIDLNQTLLPNKYIQQSLPTISFNGKMVMNVIILLNLALAFLVLDRAVLKPWFERRRMHVS
jgi:hypothetical protein